jgi:hypothetical protein
MLTRMLRTRISVSQDENCGSYLQSSSAYFLSRTSPTSIINRREPLRRNGMQVLAACSLMPSSSSCSTPFGAKNIAELRAKVLAGRFKPILPGRYSEDLITVINGLLQLNPAKRLDMAKLMTLPRMATLASAARRAHEDKGQSSDQDLLKTIKVEHLAFNMGMFWGGMCSSAPKRIFCSGMCSSGPRTHVPIAGRGKLWNTVGVQDGVVNL